MLASGPWGPGGAGGAARVVEVIDYDFGNRERHGIYRDVSGLDPGDPVEVSSPSAPTRSR